MNWKRCIAIALVAVGCASGPRTARDPMPSMLVGRFVDDYGNRYAIDAATWTQLPHGRFHVVRWNADRQYLIAQNDSANTHAPGRWTRIDWMTLPNMVPYTWAFCLTAYEAPTPAAAESTTTARRETPRTGCNGFPFSRMRAADPPAP